MKTLIIYDSQFGNTRLIADEIAGVLQEYSEVSITRAADAGPDIFTGVDLLVVGGPTHAHGLSQGMKGLLGTAAGLAPTAPRPMALAFDTRLDWPKWLSGSAADKIAHLLEGMECPMLADPGSFIVEGSEGPLAEGEKERAIAWIRAAVERMPTLTPVGV